MSLEKEGTDLQRGGKIFGVCSERRHEAVRPVQKRGSFENPATENQMTGLRVLGSHWVCRIWVPGYCQMAQPLYELLTGPEGDSLNWTERQQQAFEELKLAIMLPSLTLSLPYPHSKMSLQAPHMLNCS